MHGLSLTPLLCPRKQWSPYSLVRIAILPVCSFHRLAASSTGRASAVQPFPAKFLNLSGAPYLLSEVTGSASVMVLLTKKTSQMACLICWWSLQDLNRVVAGCAQSFTRLEKSVCAKTHTLRRSSFPRQVSELVGGPVFIIGGHRFCIRNGTINKKDKPNGLSHLLVVVTGLEPVTSRTSSGCATSCAKRPGYLIVNLYELYLLHLQPLRSRLQYKNLPAAEPCYSLCS